MNLDNAQTQSTAKHQERRQHDDTRLHGRWITPVHIIWAILTICTLVIFFTSLPVYFAQLQVSCQATSCASGQLNLSAVQSLHNFGLTLKDYAILSLLLGLLWSFIWFAVGVTLAWRKYNDWMALLVALMLIMQGSESVLTTIEGSNSLWSVPALLVRFLAYFLLTLVLVLFPNGRFVPRWSYWLVLIFFLLSGQVDFFPNLTNTWIILVDNLLFIALVISLLVIQVYRYWRVSHLLERQQTKWIVFCFALFLVISVVTTLFPVLSLPGSISSLIFGSNFSYPFLLIPLSFGIAILRYRLYDIDILINRTLVYGTLTAILILTYGSLIFVLQSLTHVLTGRAGNNPIVIVASTLVIAALFQPLRRRIQRIIDRRFYRSKYDATRILAAFSATLHQEVDLDHLHENLLVAVQETMQPSHVSLWLRPIEQSKKHQMTWISTPPASQSDDR